MSGEWRECFLLPERFYSFIFEILFRLQELEDQYRKEREEASNLLEQQRLVSEGPLTVRFTSSKIFFSFIEIFSIF